MVQPKAGPRKGQSYFRRKGLLFTTVIALCLLGNVLLTWFAGASLGLYDSSTTNGFSDASRSNRGPLKALVGDRNGHRQPQALPKRDSSSEMAGFVHIGKTAGSTISTLLRNGCTSFVTGVCRNVTNESAVSKLVEHYYHVPDFHRLPSSNHKSYIISIRDVFDRTVSSLLYHHPENAKAYNLKLTSKQAMFGPMVYECFPTLEVFASYMKGNTEQCNYPYRHNVVSTDDCGALACAVIHGKVRFFTHLFFNYRNILYTKLPDKPPREIFLLRQEKLWSDWKDLNLRLGQQEPIFIPPSRANERNISGLALPVTRDISHAGRLKLCKALENEYIAYFRLIKKASNMNEDDLESSRKVAEEHCPNLDTEAMTRDMEGR